MENVVVESERDGTDLDPSVARGKGGRVENVRADSSDSRYTK